MNNSSVTGNWEELFDSGQLDHQLQPLKPFHSSSSNSISTPTIITLQGDDSSKSIYRPPATTMTTTEPKLKILKRPSSSPNFQKLQAPSQQPTQLLPLQQQKTPPPPPQLQLQQQNQLQPSSNSNNTTDSSRHKKSLKQREEEYAMARLRILGSAGTPPDLPDFSVPPPPLPAKFVQQYRPVDNSVVRPPKGPDGSKGFTK